MGVVLTQIPTWVRSSFPTITSTIVRGVACQGPFRSGGPQRRQQQRRRRIATCNHNYNDITCQRFDGGISSFFSATNSTTRQIRGVQDYHSSSHHAMVDREDPDDNDVPRNILVDLRRTELSYPSVPALTNNKDVNKDGDDRNHEVPEGTKSLHVEASAPSILVDLRILDPTMSTDISHRRNSRRTTRRQKGSVPDDGVDGPGGYALLGRNGMGKSMIGQAIVACGAYNASNNNKRIHKSGRRNHGPIMVSDGGNWEWPTRLWNTDGDHRPSFSTASSMAVAHVSFDSHHTLLSARQDFEEDEEGSGVRAASGTGEAEPMRPMTTFQAISGGSSRLNKAAQFLIVRFGLYGLLSRTVDTLSTGEIRKTLLVRALSQRPKLLILDNAFDGLDVASREVLKQMVQKTIVGFHQDVLVQGVSSKATAKTQVLMMTHRPEELVDGIQHVTYWEPPEKDTIGKDYNDDEENETDDDKKARFIRMKTEHRNGRSGMQLFETALHLEPGSIVSYDWEDITVPSNDAIATWWDRRGMDVQMRNDSSSSSSSSSGEANSRTLVEAHHLSIHRGEATLLHDLNWSVQGGERWLIGGDNGAGKSTLSRMLARPDYPNILSQDGSMMNRLKIQGSIGWVSTERHMEMTKSQSTALQVLTEATTTHDEKSSAESAREVASWLGVSDLMDRPFCYLSQGQQKMVLIGAALTSRPDLLVLDEPCQGLDVFSRHRVLVLVERICRATDMSLVYITHHLEELLPSVSHALHLKDKRAAFQGPIQDYDPKNL